MYVLVFDGFAKWTATNALGYTPGTSNFSGSYNDLTDKPTIPTNYVTTNTGQTISGFKTFTNIKIHLREQCYCPSVNIKTI